MNEHHVYDCNDTNNVVNIKNLNTVIQQRILLNCSTARDDFFYLNTNRHTEKRVDQANYDKGFATRKALLGTFVKTEISNTIGYIW